MTGLDHPHIVRVLEYAEHDATRPICALVSGSGMLAAE